MDENAKEPMDVEEECKDDSLSDEEDDDIDTEAMKKIETLTERLSAAPYEYQSHIDLIEVLRKVGEFQKLQDARSRMANIFPLTQTLWLEWIEDEKKFAETEEEHEKIIELFERAVQDYMCPEIWLEYSQYCIRWMGTEEGMSKIRNVMERALAAAGLHLTKGTALWETYRELENAILLTLQPKPGTVASPEQAEEMRKQVQRIESLFKRQLAIPLQGMESTFQELSELSDNEIDPNIRRTYEYARKQLEELMPFEDALAAAAPPRLEEYQNYIQHETKSGDLARIQCIYERALAESCLSPDLWMQYLKYLNYKIKQGDIVVKVHHRSVRNCPWVGKLWVQYMLALERNNASKEKINNVFDEALLAGFTTASEYVDLWRTKCEQIRRRLSHDDNNSQDKEELRDCFNKATQYITETLLPAFNDTGDPDYSMWRFWARCEAGCLNSKERAVEVLQKLIKDDAVARRKVSLYAEYINIERFYGGEDKIEKCRTILRQAVQNCAIMPDSDRGGVPDAEVACEMLLDFEREHGTLEDMDESLRRVNNKMSRVTKRKEKGGYAAPTQPYKKPDKKQTNKGKGGGRKRKISEGEKQANKSQVRTPTKQGDLHEQSKRSKDMEQSSSAAGFKAPSAPPMRYEKKSPTKKPGKERDQNKNLPPPGFKEPTTGTTGPPPPGFKGPPPSKAPPPGFKGPPPPGFQEKVDTKFDVNNNKAMTDVDMQDKTATIESSGTEKDSERTEEEMSTVFISNLDFKLLNVEERLRSVFCSCGRITEIRLAKNNKGQFRGFGFIQFEDKSAVEEALKHDREDIDGRPMYVSPNVDKKKQPNFKVFKYELGLEKQKLFVSNLSFHTNEESLAKEFSPHGDIKSLRIVTNRSGRSKGLAYIEYQTEAQAAQAVLKMDGKEIDGFEIQVAISNPPARRQQAPIDAGASLGGGGGRDQFKGRRGRGRTQLSMLPRSLHRPEKVANGAAEKTDAQPSTSAGGMSNRDFAKMLLKK